MLKCRLSQLFLPSMAMKIASLNSGSNANCYYIGNDHNALLIDTGLSCRETEKRLLRLGIDIRSIDAVFITHEHNDHVSGLPSLIKKYRLPVYLTKGTLTNLPVPVEKDQACVISPGDKIPIGSLQVHTFTKHHDAAEPCSLLVSDGTHCIGVMTDIGHSCKEVKKHFSLCDAVFLESNYCEEMLRNSKYPESLKKRIQGRDGHLSNDQALELFRKHRSKRLQHLILSHLSQNNNTHEIARNTFANHLGSTLLTIASRYKESGLLSLSVQKNNKRSVTGPLGKFVSTQLKLF